MLRASGRRGRQARRRRNQGDPPSQGSCRGCLECRPLIELWKQLTKFSIFKACCGGVDGDNNASDSDDENAAERSEEVKEAAKAQLMDVLDGKLRSTSPKGANSSPKTGGGLDATPAAAIAVIRAPSVKTTPKKNPAKPGSAETPRLTSETVVAAPSPPAETKTTGAAAAPVISDAPVGKAAGSSARKIVSTNAPPFVPRVPASASFAMMHPTAAASSASKPPPAVSKPPLPTPTSTAKTGGGLEKNKSSLRASAKEWKLNPAAPEWKPAASFAPTASPAIAPTTAPASGSVPAQIATGAGVGGGAPHHMGAVPPHLMRGAPHGPMQPQQYPLYWTASMGHHPQQDPSGMMMGMGGGVHGGGLWGWSSLDDHGRDGEWDMAARAAGILEEVDSPAKTARPENTGAEARAGSVTADTPDEHETDCGTGEGGQHTYVGE